MPSESSPGISAKSICMDCSREFAGEEQRCPFDGSVLINLAQDPWIGVTLADKYKIDRKIGVGSMGVVYVAWHQLMERWVAIKMLKRSVAEGESSLKRFQQEVKATSRLNHPGVVTVHDFGVTNTGQPYMVMDYLNSSSKDPTKQARSLATDIKESKQIPVNTIVHIVQQACLALEHAHRQGVIHRDVKPANIMIVPSEDDDYFVKVVDFGVAKLLTVNNANPDSHALTQTGEVVGSPVYMSPEQCMGQNLDPRTDIYSMGVILYEALTGKVPLKGNTLVETMGKHITEMPQEFGAVRPDLFIPNWLEDIVFRAMAKDPSERQQSMAELAQELRNAASVSDRKPARRTITTKERFGAHQSLVVVTICLLALVAFLGVYAAMHNPAITVRTPKTPDKQTTPSSGDHAAVSPAPQPQTHIFPEQPKATAPSSSSPQSTAHAPAEVKPAEPPHRAVVHTAPPMKATHKPAVSTVVRKVSKPTPAKARDPFSDLKSLYSRERSGE